MYSFKVTANNKVFYNLKSTTYKKVIRVIEENVRHDTEISLDASKSLITIRSEELLDVERLINEVKDAKIKQNVTENPTKENTKYHKNAKIGIKYVIEE